MVEKPSRTTSEPDHDQDTIADKRARPKEHTGSKERMPPKLRKKPGYDKRGGARMGAGRKPGGKNAATMDLERAAAGVWVSMSDEMPLDYMLGIMRGKRKFNINKFKAANAALPYCHPRLSAIEHTGQMTVMTHEEALRKLK